jgi:hypothetical protein
MGPVSKTNKMVNQAIRYHVDMNQKGWLKQLPWIRFALMNTLNSSTGVSGFQLKTGCSPRIIPPIAPLPNNATPDDITVHATIDKLNIDVHEAQDNLLAAKTCQAYHANQHCGKEIVYEVGQMVMLSMENRRWNYKQKGKKRVAKFMPQNDGPYLVTATFPEQSKYTLQLPNNPQMFPGFYASLLKPFIANNPMLFPSCKVTRPSPVVTEDGIEEVHIEKIVDT